MLKLRLRRLVKPVSHARNGLDIFLTGMRFEFLPEAGDGAVNCPFYIYRFFLPYSLVEFFLADNPAGMRCQIA